MLKELTLYQIAMASVALVFIVNEFRKIFMGCPYQPFFKFFSITLMWGCVLVFALFPEAPHHISLRLGLGASLNTLIFTGFVATFFAIFRLLEKMERIEKSLTQLVRNEALKAALEREK